VKFALQTVANLGLNMIQEKNLNIRDHHMEAQEQTVQINTSCETVTEPKQTQSSRCCFHEQLKLKKATLSRAKSNKMAIAILIHCVLIY